MAFNKAVFKKQEHTEHYNWCKHRAAETLYFLHYNVFTKSHFPCRPFILK